MYHSRPNSGEIIRVRISAATLISIFKDQSRFSDALIPTQMGLEPIYMVENRMFKRDITNQVGRLIRFPQTGSYI